MPKDRQTPELLAPAGGMEQLQAAIRYGADAVYLATDRFGMRARAANFTLDELPAAVALAHAAGVQVHVACNVLMVGADDIAALPAYFRALQRAGVDAVILSDLGALRIARRCAPDLSIHVSTQASVANAEAACMWHELGARRVVCAREMTLADIAALRAATPSDLEIEAFVHGAQCMAVSGRCLISSYLTNRSGNKGHCTQPCRWNYALEEEKRPGEYFPVEEDGRGTFIMNAKDLNMLAHVRELVDAGVSSLKIEGRNKKAFYVASVVNAYRRVLDGADAADVALELETVSHRPYSTGFYFSEPQQACDYDGYEQSCLHVADVVACEPVSASELASAPDPAFDPDPSAILAPISAFDSASSFDVEPLPQREAEFAIVARCRNRFAEGDELEVLLPRYSALEVEVKNLAWLPDPEEGKPRQVSESVSPFAQVAASGFASDPVSASGLASDFAVGSAPSPSPAPDSDSDPASELSAFALAASTPACVPAPVPVPVANRSCALYRFVVKGDANLLGLIEPGHFLRVRTPRRSSRH